MRKVVVNLCTSKAQITLEVFNETWEEIKEFQNSYQGQWHIIGGLYI